MPKIPRADRDPRLRDVVARLLGVLAQPQEDEQPLALEGLGPDAGDPERSKQALPPPAFARRCFTSAPATNTTANQMAKDQAGTEIRLLDDERGGQGLGRRAVSTSVSGFLIVLMFF